MDKKKHRYQTHYLLPMRNFIQSLPIKSISRKYSSHRQNKIELWTILIISIFQLTIHLRETYQNDTDK